MKRNYQKSTCCAINDQDLIRQTAFHEAGHAAGIYLYNKYKQLPPVYFQISINPVHRPIEKTWDTLGLAGDHFTAIVEGGRLISSLPIAIIESTEFFSEHQQDAYQTAFEADMINLLIGPIAEARYVAFRDNECFNAQLINIHALHNYGGTSDLNQVHEYLNTFIAARSQHQVKLAELFNHAFQFVTSPIYWKAIERLADYILNNHENVISCEQVIAVLDQG